VNAGLKGLDGVFGVLVKVVAEDDGVQTGMNELVKVSIELGLSSPLKKILKEIIMIIMNSHTQAKEY